MYLIEFEEKETLNIDAEQLNRFVDQATLVEHVARFLKLLSVRYPGCDVGFLFCDFDPDPTSHHYYVYVSLKEEPDTGDPTVVDLTIDPSTWMITVDHGDREFDGNYLRDVVNPTAYPSETEPRRLVVDPDNYHLLDRSAKSIGVPITDQMNKLLYAALDVYAERHGDFLKGD
jgi:hypothetical protein